MADVRIFYCGYNRKEYLCSVKYQPLMKQTIITTLLALATMTGQAQEKCDSIPFIYHSHIYIPTVINDSVKCNIIYDTGAANLFGVDSVFLAHSAWKPQKMGHAFAGGGAGKTRVRVIADKTRVKAGTIIGNYDIVPVFKLRDIVDCHTDGIMGIKNISDYPFEINFEHHYLKPHKSGLPNTADYEKLPIKYEDNKLLLQAEICMNGTSIKGWYLMDTGSGGTIDFTAHTVSQYKLDAMTAKRYFTDMTQLGIGDKKQEVVVDMMSDRIVIGRDTICRMPISYLPEGTGAFSNRSYLGVIGNGIWSDYNIIIDAKNNVLYLRRFKPATPKGPTYDYGFRNRTDICRGWIVSSLVRDGDAIRAGMELGDTITAINGKNVSEYSWDEEENLDHTPKQTITIVTSNGQEKQITLEAKERW